MPFFATTLLTTGAAIVGIKTKQPQLVRMLDSREPKPAVVPSSTFPTALTQVRQLAQDLFSDTRQRQQQALNATYDVTAAQEIERVHRQNFIVAGSGLGFAGLGALVTPLFYLPSIVCSLFSFRLVFQETYRAYKEERRLDYRVVWAITIPLALVSGYVTAASFSGVLGFLNFYLGAKTESRSKRHIADLFGGQIHTAWLLVDGVAVETPFAQIQVGDTVVVHAGQMIPVDGTIIQGTATVDQHVLTGEAQPAEKEVGEPVLASTVLLSGCLHIRVDKAGDATVAAQITDMLSQTTDFKRTLESRTDRLMNQITLPTLGLSALALPVAGVGGAVAILWYYPGARMMYFGPMSMLSYLQVAAQRGILIKDGRALESLQQIDTVIFDKTGTLTLEQPTVSRIRCYNGMAEAAVLRYAAAAEAKQSHPIARAILQRADEQGLELPLLEDAHYEVGYGLKTQIEGRTVLIGSIRFMTMEEVTVPTDVVAQQAECYAQGHSLVLVALDREVVGAVELEPTIRPEARQIISDLHKRGIETAIISGDNSTPTRHLAAELGIDRYFAEVLPEDKANLVKQLQAEGHKVCFVGDGINDAIALKTADVAVSLRGATTIATDMAEIVFMDGALRQLPELFLLADEFAVNMRTNMFAAVLPGALGIAGTLLFGWGMGICVLLLQASTPVGIYNALKPMVDERKNQENLSVSG